MKLTSSTLRTAIEHMIHLQKPGILLQGILLPLTLASFLFRAVVRLRWLLYARGFLKSTQLPCKVISIGNITVGGTGKTPLVCHIAQHLNAAGINTVVLTRGYRGTDPATSLIVSDGKQILAQPQQSGDEAFMLAKKLPGVPVLAGKDRIALGEIAVKRFTARIALLDDGFQYCPLKRDMDIVLLNAANPFGNGFLLPRGTLREPLSALVRSAIVVLTKIEKSMDISLLEHRIKHYNPQARIFKSSVVARTLRNALTGEALPCDTIQGKRVVSLCSIGDPGSFFHMLESLQPAALQQLIFPDHHWYDVADYKTINNFGDAADFIITTEKDIAKMDFNMIHSNKLTALEIGLAIEREEELFQHLYQVCGKDLG